MNRGFITTQWWAAARNATYRRRAWTHVHAPPTVSSALPSTAVHPLGHRSRPRPTRRPPAHTAAATHAHDTKQQALAVAPHGQGRQKTHQRGDQTTSIPPARPPLAAGCPGDQSALAAPAASAIARHAEGRTRTPAALLDSHAP